jgi:hypothetical protein
MKRNVSLEWGYGHTFQHFSVRFSAFLMTRSGDLGVETPKVVKPEIPFWKRKDLWIEFMGFQ